MVSKAASMGFRFLYMYDVPSKITDAGPNGLVGFSTYIQAAPCARHLRLFVHISDRWHPHRRRQGLGRRGSELHRRVLQGRCE